MPGPLAGIKVADFGWAKAAPFCTMILADLGATVVKVERLTGDFSREVGPYVSGMSTYFASINRGKLSLAIDLKIPEGREIARQLAGWADILVENMVPGAMDRLGLGYSELGALYPRLIYASISGFGHTGPYRDRGAVDLSIQAMSGLMSMHGEEDGLPLRCAVSLADLNGGVFAAVGILAALEERHRSGKGQHLDLSLLDCAVALLESPFICLLSEGHAPKRSGARHPLLSPFHPVPARDGYVVLAVANETQWKSFCEAVDRPELAADPRFESGTLRRRNAEVFDPILEEITRSRTVQEWVDLMTSLGIPCTPIRSLEEVARDPQLTERDMFVTVEGADGSTMGMVGTPFRLSRTQATVERGAPVVGADTRHVLVDLLGLPETRVQELVGANVLVTDDCSRKRPAEALERAGH